MIDRAVVTGATGFIGSALSRHLSHSGVAVHALVRDAGAGRSRALAAAGVQLHEIGGDWEAIRPAVAAASPDVVFHLATTFVGQHSNAQQVVDMINANVTLGTLVADAAVANDAPMVVTSSAYQHFEGAAYRPISLYAATKQCLEDILEWYSLDRDLRATRLVLFDSYGPHDPRGKLMSRLLEIAQTGERFRMSSGTQLLALTYVDDIVDALLLAGEALAEGGEGVHRMARTREPMPLRSIAAELERVTGRALAIEWGALEDRPHEMRTPWDIAPMLDGWEPRVSLAEGLSRTWAAMGGAA